MPSNSHSIRSRSETDRNSEQVKPRLQSYQSTACLSVFHDEGGLCLVKFHRLFDQRTTSVISNYEESPRSQPTNQPVSLVGVDNFGAELRNDGAAPPFYREHVFANCIILARSSLQKEVSESETENDLSARHSIPVWWRQHHV